MPDDLAAIVARVRDHLSSTRFDSAVVKRKTIAALCDAVERLTKELDEARRVAKELLKVAAHRYGVYCQTLVELHSWLAMEADDPS